MEIKFDTLFLSGADHAVDLKKVLQFITGGSLLPATKINVYFDNSKPLPDADCCFNKIILPSGQFQLQHFQNGTVRSNFMSVSGHRTHVK